MVEISQNINYSDFDVINFVKQILNEIERIRSVGDVNPNNGFETMIFSSPKESRLNAFFRLVGLPSYVVRKSIKEKSSNANEEGSILSPGFQIGRNNDEKIENCEKLGNLNLKTILADRERHFSSIENARGSVISNQKMTEAFYHPIYIIPNISEDEGAINVESGTTVKRNVYRKLFPLITSYQKIMPIRNEIARPFATEDQCKVDDETILMKPFIETVARIRFLTAESSDNESQIEKENNKMESFQSILSEEQYTQVEENFKAMKTAGMLENFILNKMLASIEKLAQKWNEIIRERDRLVSESALIEIKLKTSSSRKNILGKAVQPSSNVEIKSNHAKMKKMENIKKIIAVEEAFLMLFPSSDGINIAKPNQAQTQNTISNSLQNEFNKLIYGDIDKWKKELNKETSQLNSQMQRAEKIRIEMDMMTGEFSGISILDVISVICALFLISKQDLLALFDKQAIENMKNENKSLEAFVESVGTPSSFESAISNLEQKVESVFLLFQSLNLQLKYNRRNVKRKPKNKNKNKKDKRAVQTISDISNQSSESVGE